MSSIRELDDRIYIVSFQVATLEIYEHLMDGIV